MTEKRKRVLMPLFVAAAALLSAAVVKADIEDGKKIATTVCVACHGEAGNATVTANPILAGQTFRYMYLQLKDFKEGRRKDPGMEAIVSTLSKEDMQSVSQYYAAQKQKSNPFKADAARIARGKVKADEVLCTMCHLGGFLGQNEIPRVAGQHPEYVIKQLKDFKARTRNNDAGSMTAVAQTITEEDIVDLAHYLVNLN